MRDRASTDDHIVLELRAREIRGYERVLVAERVCDQDGRRVIWHVPEQDIRGILWLEILVEEGAGSLPD